MLGVKLLEISVSKPSISNSGQTDIILQTACKSELPGFNPSRVNYLINYAQPDEAVLVNVLREYYVLDHLSSYAPYQVLFAHPCQLTSQHQVLLGHSPPRDG
jgi:hypothetical protein